MHIGYTGTCVCIDPVNKIWSVVLTNRVYQMGSSDATKSVYRQFNSGIVDMFV
jgi:CubicO group peptidase (beta-lactamase class C family)